VGAGIAAGSISAALSGGTSPTGTITFKVFGPQASAPSTCTSGGTTVGTAAASGNGTYHPSAGFTPSTAGTYWWYASYGGDTNNAASNSTCGAGMASTVAWSTSSAANVTTTTVLSTSSTTSSFTVQPSTTYLLFVARGSSSGDSITSISSSGLAPSLTTASFTAITSQTFNTSDYQWAYYITTGSTASGTGTLTVNFGRSLPLGGETIVDLVQVRGNNTTTPIVTSNEKATSGNGTTPTANLPSAPASQDATMVFLAGTADLGASAPLGTPAMANVFYSHQTAGSAGVNAAIPGTQNESFTISSQAWGTIAIELAHG
jgi:hypothetical protein